MRSVRIGRAVLELVTGDIAAQRVDAVVNAANDHLWMGAGVAGAIRRAGGADIEREAVARGPIGIGECVATTAGALPARRVIHAAVMGQDLRTSADAIRRATRNALVLAAAEGLASVALPAFGTGVGGFALEACADIMIDEVVRVLPEVPALTAIRIVLRDAAAADVFARVLGRAFSAAGHRGDA